MKLVFFTFYYPPDLCAGSFRAVALARALSSKLDSCDEIHIITTHPNRYSTHKVEAESYFAEGNIKIHRIHVPTHKSGMVSQARTFLKYAWSACLLCIKIRPDFVIGTTSRLMTGVLTWFSAAIIRRPYFIDLRDIFSETISDIFKLKNWLLGKITKVIFSFIEKRVFSNAAGVNVVSLGFPDYFEAQGISTSNWTFFPNGVDSEFIGLSQHKKINQDGIKTVLYAGNIGNGQGLETIIPAVAKSLGEQYKFLIVGDGGTKQQLEKMLELEGVGNVELLPPVGRVELIQYYESSDILFLHLNDYPAFKRVLPSKIFEYAAIGKPVVAGLSGYSAEFVRDNINHACVFDPRDVKSCVLCIKEASTADIAQSTIDDFILNYSRSKIMDAMSSHILLVVEKGAVSER